MSFKHTLQNINIEDEYPKLVRDKIPEIIKRKEGTEVRAKKLASDQEYLSYLFQKVAEEAGELSRASSKTNISEEIADVREVIEAIMKLKGISESEVTRVQKDKLINRGGFGQRVLLIENPKRP